MTTQRIARRKMVGFQTDLVVSSGDTNYNTSALVAAIIESNTSVPAYSLCWQLTCPAQQILAWGYGAAQLQRNQGYMWFYAADLTTSFEEGNLRLVIANARSTRVQVVKELNTQRLHTTNPATDISATPTDINTMIPLPEAVLFPKVGENSLLQLFFKTTIPTTVVDSVNFSIPSTSFQ